ncbi:e3 SUMO ligase pli1 [Fusarium phyllophilum]|uniref:E3 SUMO ligase pli1 n=1 Tax=Fusarium phyllophilum TaxID=47803 RepID=A0A8H5IJ56_9HYPO|nr:e3 SUMO ligase pli1 [Fusarium phyllophilum]
MASSDRSAASPAALFFRSINLAKEGRRGTDSRNRRHPYIRKIPEAQRTGTSTQSKRPAQDFTSEPRTISFTVSCEDGSALQKRINDPSYQVGIFCAGGLKDVQDIRFPDGSRIKVDGLNGRVSFGRKNKPGSVTSIDISKGLRLRPGPTHTVELTYGPTTNEFYLVILLCKKRSIEEVVDDITKLEKIPTTSLYPEIRCIAQDPSIVATSQVLTLRCPLSQKRLEFPCRGLDCKHWQCFDGTTYIQLQEQSPQWECPICYAYVPFDALAVDGYMTNILHKTPKSQERVIIDANGKWHAGPSNRWSPSAGHKAGHKASVIDLTLSGEDSEALQPTKGYEISGDIKTGKGNMPG